MPLERIYLITGHDYRDEVAQELPEIPKNQVIVEPARRNTAMAAGYGVCVIALKDPQAIIANIWSDHFIKNPDAYRDSLLAGAKAASDGVNLVTTGVSPEYPHTGLGYVKKGPAFASEGTVNIYEIEKFVEKPKILDAKKMIVSGRYLWHVGLFIWRVDTFMKALKTYSSGTFDRLSEISRTLSQGLSKDRIIKAYLSAPDLSIDVAIATKARNFLVVEGTFGWKDVGDFQVLWSVEEKDKDGNAILTFDDGEWKGLETQESIVIAEGKRVVATIGLTDMIVVSTDDATLVAPKSQAQKVKKIVERLKEEKKKEFL